MIICSTNGRQRIAAVISWLLHSMQPDISGTFLFLFTENEIQDAVHWTYSQVGQIARVYRLCQRIIAYGR